VSAWFELIYAGADDDVAQVRVGVTQAWLLGLFGGVLYFTVSFAARLKCLALGLMEAPDIPEG
jgi:hypothetical protein